MKNKKIIITNNPLVSDISCSDKVEYHDIDYLGVLIKVRDKIHLGHWLLTHPLYGSVKPGETPYRTVLLSAERGSLDEQSLIMVEESIETFKKFVGVIAESPENVGTGYATSIFPLSEGERGSLVAISETAKPTNWTKEKLNDLQLIDCNLIFGKER
jgi:hypothetical protein